MHLFEKIARKSIRDDDANLGKASCLFGMAHIMFHYRHNFITQTSDEDSVLRQVATHFEQAIDIYKRRNHIDGAAHCLQNLAIVRKKLSLTFLHLS